VIVAPDSGAAKRARKMAELLQCKMAMIDKREKDDDSLEIDKKSLTIIGAVTKFAVIVDDIVDTAATMCDAADVLKEHGVKDVYGCATHGILSGKAIERINNSPLIELILTDSLPIQNISEKSSKITVLPVAHLMGEAIRRIHNEESVSSLFQFQ